MQVGRMAGQSSGQPLARWRLFALFVNQHACSGDRAARYDIYTWRNAAVHLAIGLQWQRQMHKVPGPCMCVARTSLCDTLCQG